ncbi:amino acid racemase [Candidatus Gottesmanbacteria bacterium]|nr:amino acid racemase [Candidatus Gottesmanbacteria bacterium]
MKHIGIVGVTVPGGILCIDTIVSESFTHFGKESLIHPRITYTNPSLSEIHPPIHDKDWVTVTKVLLSSIVILHKAGADFAIIPSNSPHYAIKEVQQKSPIPIISIVDITVAECKRRGFKKVGILGVGVTMSDGLYEKPLKAVGIIPATLPSNRQKKVNDLIIKEIIQGKPTAQTTSKMQGFIQELKDLGCDAFIAGCTEIPVVITSESDSPLPYVDTTRLLAQKAFQEAIRK